MAFAWLALLLFPWLFSFPLLPLGVALALSPPALSPPVLSSPALSSSALPSWGPFGLAVADAPGVLPAGWVGRRVVRMVGLGPLPPCGELGPADGAGRPDTGAGAPKTVCATS